MRTNRLVMGLALAAILGGCGDDGADRAATPDTPTSPPPAAESAPAPAAAPAPEAAPAPAAAPAAGESAPPAAPPAAAGDDEELVYEPIDTSKLENTWYKQYSAGQ